MYCSTIYPLCCYLKFFTVISVIVKNSNTIGILNFNVVGTSYQW